DQTRRHADAGRARRRWPARGNPPACPYRCQHMTAKLKHRLFHLSMAALFLFSTAALAAEPAHITNSRAPVGTQQPPLDIYGSTDLWAMRPLINDFHRQYPRIDVRYHLLTTQDMYRNFLDAANTGT